MERVQPLAHPPSGWRKRLALWAHRATVALGWPTGSTLPEQAAPSSSEAAIPCYLELAQGKDFPVLSGPQLIELLQLQTRVSAIRQLLGLPEPDWLELGLSSIHAVAEAVQLCPASEVHHHAFAGGLLVHTLEVAEHALRLRKRYQLPIGAGAEAVNEAGPRWTFAVFSAALLHDPGKLVASVQVMVESPGCPPHRWSPLDQPLPPGLRYRVQFSAVPYRLHAQASLALFSALLPASARRWLSSDPGLLSQLLSSTYDASAPEGGAIAEIIRQADGASVRADLGHSSHGPLSTAQASPLVDRIMRAVQCLVADGELKANAPGAQLWVSEGRKGAQGAEREAWVLCKSLADSVIGRLRSEGDVAVPGNNERIFDTLQEHGMVKATREGQAIWSVRVSLEGWTNEFRVLRFPAWRLWPPGRVPEAKAKVSVLKPKSDRRVDGVASQVPGSATVGSPGHRSEEAVIPPNTHAQCEPVGGRDSAVKSTETPAASVDDADLLEVLMGGSPSRVKSQARRIERNSRPKGPPTQDSVASAPPAGPISEGREGEPASNIIDWLRSGLGDGSISFNDESAFVHGGPEGTLLLVSPRCFREYALCHGGDWMEAQSTLSKSFPVRRKGKRTVLPFRVTRGGAVVNCMVLESPLPPGFSMITSNFLLQPLHD